MTFTLIFFIAGTVCACLAYKLKDEEHEVSTQVGLWFLSLIAFIVVFRYMQVADTELNWLFEDMPGFWRHLITLSVLVILVVQSLPLWHHIDMHHIHGKTEHAISSTAKETAETVLKRAKASRKKGLTVAEETALLMAQKAHEEEMRQRRAGLDVDYIQRRQEIDLDLIRKKDNSEFDLVHMEAVQALELARAKALAKMDIKKEKAIFKMKVESSMRVQLAPDHELLEVYRLMLQNMADLGSMNKDKKRAAEALYEHFTARFEELRHKKTA